MSDQAVMVKRPPRWIWIVLITICAAVAFWLWHQQPGESPSSQSGPSHHWGGGQSGRQPMDLAVVTATAKTGDINVYLNALGSVTALNTVTVRYQVSGQLIKVYFHEGQIVKEDEPLAEIDPRPFEIQLAQAEGQLAKDQALLSDAKLNLNRYQVLGAEDSIPQQQLDTQKSLVDQYEGTIKVDRAQVDSAKLQLAYAHVKAPISGQIGLRLEDAGNIVGPNDATGLAVITKLQPITVVFAIPEDNLPSVLSQYQTGRKLAVDAYNREETKKIATGTLEAVDSQIDQATGTVKLKAIFDNKDNALFPNQFVNIHLLVNVAKGAVIVPLAAIQQGPQGAFVFVVGPDNTVAVRQVVQGPTQDDNVAITQGLSSGEVVVVEGADKLKDGSPVTVAGQPSGSSEISSEKPSESQPSKGYKHNRHKKSHSSGDTS